MKSVQSGNDVTDSLIVLPEAFNLGRQYDLNDKPKEKPLFGERDVLARLHEIATTHKVVFVVGLIEIETRRNSAYLVDARSPRLMCHKIMN
ncbi:MAG TPA: nitrilase-related carbon-nitrogen hydrolase, partial [Bryobacteraceae bacterium]|nr:nitrilase-related carbon-nitrogen hydrolase [Bryobacteraceae bacterium]